MMRDSSLDKTAGPTRWISNHNTAADTDVVITIPASSEYFTLDKIVWSFSSDPSNNATLKIDFGDNHVIQFYIDKRTGWDGLNLKDSEDSSGVHHPNKATNKPIVITLSSGGPSIIGTLSVYYR